DGSLDGPNDSSFISAGLASTMSLRPSIRSGLPSILTMNFAVSAMSATSEENADCQGGNSVVAALSCQSVPGGVKPRPVLNGRGSNERVERVLVRLQNTAKKQ